MQCQFRLHVPQLALNFNYVFRDSFEILSNVLDKITELDKVIIWTSAEINFVSPGKIMDKQENLQGKGTTVINNNILMEYLVRVNPFLLQLLKFSE